MAGWHHWLDGCESEWTPGVGDGQGGLVCCDSWGRKESDTTERMNWTELNRWFCIEGPRQKVGKAHIAELAIIQLLPHFNLVTLIFIFCKLESFISKRNILDSFPTLFFVEIWVHPCAIYKDSCLPTSWQSIFLSFSSKSISRDKSQINKCQVIFHTQKQVFLKYHYEFLQCFISNLSKF